jgi:hypothetical protein
MVKERIEMKIYRVAIAILFTFGAYGAGAPLAKAQSASGTGSSTTTSTTSVQPGQRYVKPSHAQKFRNYLFDSFGPYAIIGSAAAAGINQASGDRINGHGSGTPPEWGGGVGPYFQRFASNFGINLTATTTRYVFAEVLREDTIYYRCDCSGFSHRLVHALMSTVADRHGDDGHYRFSIPNFVAPYAGTMTAALTWYPNRYGPSDGFRMGNYLLLSYAGVNVAKEFIYGGPHTLMAHTPLKHMTGSDKP